MLDNVIIVLTVLPQQLFLYPLPVCQISLQIFLGMVKRGGHICSHFHCVCHVLKKLASTLVGLFECSAPCDLCLGTVFGREEGRERGRERGRKGGVWILCLRGRKEVRWEGRGGGRVGRRGEKERREGGRARRCVSRFSTSN